MKYLLLSLAPLSFFMVNCSSIPEIQPYKESPKKELTIEDLRESSGFYKESEFDEPTTPIADEESDFAPSKVALSPEEIKASDDALKDDPFIKDEPLAKKDADDKLDKMMDEAPKLASVETPKAVAAKPVKEVAPSRRPSSFKNGMHTFAQNCVMRAKPNESSADQGNVQAGKKLWLDNHNGEWLKAYKKTGTVYVPAECVK